MGTYAVPTSSTRARAVAEDDRVLLIEQATIFLHLISSVLSPSRDRQYAPRPRTTEIDDHAAEGKLTQRVRDGADPSRPSGLLH
jgi:hypothetical protein